MCIRDRANAGPGPGSRAAQMIAKRRGCIFIAMKQLLSIALIVLLVSPGLNSWAGEPSRIQFENRQKQSGVAFVLHNGTTPDKPIIDSVLGGVALLDYDCLLYTSRCV